MLKRIKRFIPMFLILIILIILTVKYINYNKETSNVNEIDYFNDADGSIESIDKRIEELIALSYKYYILSRGSIDLGNDEINFGEDKYSLILLEGINSIADIDNLINDLFTATFVSKYHDDLFKSRSYLEYKDNLYINNKFDICEIDYDLTKAIVTNKTIDDILYVEFNFDDMIYYEFQLFNEDGVYKVTAPFYDCKLQSNS